MAKGQLRSNKEKKKPKQDTKVKAKPTASAFAAPALSVQRGKKKP